MANTHKTLSSLFSDIADAIRTKTGESGKIVADNFPSKISAISSGIGEKIGSYLINGGVLTASLPSGEFNYLTSICVYFKSSGNSVLCAIRDLALPVTDPNGWLGQFFTSTGAQTSHCITATMSGGNTTISWAIDPSSTYGSYYVDVYVTKY